MKIFHLSDLHIGLKLYNRDLIEDQRYVFAQIIEAASREKPDAIVIAGDIYDKAIPSVEAVEVFDEFVSGLIKALPSSSVMAISGNHDSANRVNVFRSILSRQNVYMIGIPPERPEDHMEKVTLEDEYGRLNFYLLPFVKPSMVKEITGMNDDGSAYSYNDAVRMLIEREDINTDERNVFVSHQFYIPKGISADKIERMDSEIRTVGNIDEVRADILDRFDYSALGHIHKPMCAGSQTCRYCGTPIACSISEAGQKKGIVMVDMGKKGDVKINIIPLEPLHQVREIKDTYKNVLEQGCSDYVRIVLTDREDLEVMDMQDRLRSEFPNLLEIRRETLRKADYSAEAMAQRELDPFELCTSFLKDLDDSEKDLLQDVINSVKEAQ